MQAARLQSRNKQLDENNIFEIDNLRLLRSAAVYGANASGKSNLIQAMRWMRDFVLHSSKESQAGERIKVEPFRLSTATQRAPSYFQIIFYLDGKRYRYGFELDHRAVMAEWLYHKTKRETRLFIREGDEYDLSIVFQEGHGLEERTRPNALFLSVVAQFNGQLSVALLDWFRTGLNVISGLQDVTYSAFTVRRFEKDAAFRRRVIAFVREADLGIANINVERRSLVHAQMPELTQDFALRIAERGIEGQAAGEFWVDRVKTDHKVYDKEQKAVGWETFDMEEQESQGTRKIFNLSGPLLDTLEKGQVLVIDEMEARLHPFITRAIIQLFNSPKTNPHNAQLIFATHDTRLLSNRFFRRDQIWFTEKDRYGATDLYSLAELQVRNDASFDKDYVNGKYGAIPFIGGFQDLFGAQDDGQNA